jgi:hypothetical protein
VQLTSLAGVSHGSETCKIRDLEDFRRAALPRQPFESGIQWSTGRDSGSTARPHRTRFAAVCFRSRRRRARSFPARALRNGQAGRPSEKRLALSRLDEQFLLAQVTAEPQVVDEQP